MKIQILKLGLGDLTDRSALPFDDPHGLCRFNPETIAAYRENPFLHTPDEPVQIVGTVDGCAAGTLMLLPGEIVIDGNVFSVAWCSGLYVVPEYRKSLLGITLVKEARGSCTVVGGSRVGEKALPIFERLGWTEIPLTDHVMPCRSRPVLETVFGRGRAAALFGHVIDPIFTFHHWFLEGREKVLCGDLHCEPTDSVPETLDPVLAGLNHPFGCHRSARWLNWILRNTFDGEREKQKRLYLVRDHDGRVVAYFVIRVKVHERVSRRKSNSLLGGCVLDWGVFDPFAADEGKLWLMATNTLVSEGVDFVEICEASPKASVPFGFRRLGQHSMVLFADPSGPTICRGQLQRWKMRQIDGDSGLS